MGKLLLFILLSLTAPVFCGENFGVPAKYTLLRESKDARALEVVDNCLYVGTRNSLFVYDISDALAPKKVAELKNTGTARQMASNGDYLYMTRRASGILIVDIRDRKNPQKAGFYDTVEMATGIDISGNLLFCAQRIYGVETLDISDPVNPRPLSLQRTHEAQSCVWKNGLLYVGDWGASKLTVIDMKNPSAPHKLCEKELDGYGDGVDADDKYCYAATGHHSRNKDRSKRFGNGHGLEIFCLKNPENPQKLSTVKFPKFHMTGNDYWTVRVSGNTAVVADTHNGLFIVDVTDRKAPVILKRAEFPKVKLWTKRVIPACVADIRLGDGAIYAAVQGIGLAVIPEKSVKKTPPRSRVVTAISGAAKPELANYDRYDFNCTVRRVAVKGDTAYTACSVGGLKVFDLKTRKVIQNISGICAYDAAVDGKKLYCAAGEDGIITYLIGADNRLKEIQRRNVFNDPRRKGRTTRPHVQMLMKPATGSLLIYSDRSAHIHFADTGSNLDTVARESWVRLLYGDAVSDCDINGVTPVHFCGFGTLWFKIEGNRVRLTERAADQKNLSGQSQGWTVLNGKFFAPSANGYTLLAAKNNGKGFRSRKFKGLGGTATACGNIVAITGRVKGTIRVYDFSNEDRPVELKEFSLNITGTPDRARFWNGHLLIPAGLDGLLISKKEVRSL